MRITELQPGPHTLYSLAGTILSIGEDVSIDLFAEQGDTQHIIDICADKNGALARGLGEAYAVNVLIPPAKYIDVPTGENDEDGRPMYIPEKQPLDTEGVELLLWRYAKPVTQPQTGTITEEE